MKSELSWYEHPYISSFSIARISYLVCNYWMIKLYSFKVQITIGWKCQPNDIILFALNIFWTPMKLRQWNANLLRTRRFCSSLNTRLNMRLENNNYLEQELIVVGRQYLLSKPENIRFFYVTVLNFYRVALRGGSGILGLKMLLASWCRGWK